MLAISQQQYEAHRTNNTIISKLGEIENFLEDEYSEGQNKNSHTNKDHYVSTKIMDGISLLYII